MDNPEKKTLAKNSEPSQTTSDAKATEKTVVPAETPSTAKTENVEKKPETADAPSTTKTENVEKAPENADAPSTNKTENVEKKPETADTSSTTKTENVEKAPENADAPSTLSMELPSSPNEDVFWLRKFISDFMDILETVLVSVFVVILTFTYVLCIAEVDGDSMLPTLMTEERLLVNRLDHHYETGDVLILNSIHSATFDAEGNVTTGEGIGKEIVKRLIAQSGQEVNIDFAAGIVYVDGEALEEPYTSTLTNRDEGAFTYPLIVPDGYVFVLGDNRSISKDSRHPDVGFIAVDDIVGSVLLRIAPFTVF